MRFSCRTATIAAGIFVTLGGAAPARLIADDPNVPDAGMVTSDLVGRVFSANDSLAIGDERSASAKECLDGLAWKPMPFEATCEQPARVGLGDVLIRYPSPLVSGDLRNDRVAMEWYVAQDHLGKPISARAVVVVHESGSNMTVGRIIARGLREMGLHTFMLQLPFYGQRRTDGKRPEKVDLFMRMRQGIADVRRARDAVAVLPWIDSSHIALQGTSLGGFVSSTSAGLDQGYDSVFLMLSGGELYDLIENGKRDAAKVRQELERIGIKGEDLKSLAWSIEPTRVAHRLDPDRTWLFSGSFDTVVPPKNSLALAEAVGLDPTHHIQMLANHYSGIIYLPFVLAHIRQRVTSLDVDPVRPKNSAKRRVGLGRTARCALP